MRFSSALVSLFCALSASFSFAAAPIQCTTDGTPTGLEEEIRWRVNRGRFDRTSENQLRGTSYTDILTSAGPLAPNQSLTLAARHQSEDMATHNLFQHQTVPGSAYYNPASQPEPWDRMQAEGYSWNHAGENSAAGYSGAETAYVGWWNSTGHRQNMYSTDFRETGLGYYYWSSSTYRSYYTMDLGGSGTSCFFTGTLFNDANTNGVYDQTEGVSGVTLMLLVNGVAAGYFDVSSSVGSFTIPIQSVASAATVQVVLSNSTAGALTMTIPRHYHTFNTVCLASGEEWIYGTFTKPSSVRNVGLREVTPIETPIASCQLWIVRSGNEVLLTWPAQAGQQYLPQRGTNLLEWSNLAPGYQPGTGTTMSWLDKLPGGVPARVFYRLLITWQTP